MTKNHHNPDLGNQFRDHTELYEVGTSTLRVICFHPYYISDENKQQVLDNGFIQIKPMYAGHAKSFMKVVTHSASHGQPPDYDLAGIDIQSIMLTSP